MRKKIRNWIQRHLLVTGLSSSNKVSGVGKGWYVSLVPCVCKIGNFGIFSKSMLLTIIFLFVLEKIFLIDVH